MNSIASPEPVLEALEPRLAPAGTVLLTLKSGALTILGDAEANSITITDEPATGHWIISDAGSTAFKLNGLPVTGPVTIAAPVSVKATLGDGDDSISIVPTTGQMLIAGTLSIDTGDGDDLVYLGTAGTQALTVQGAASLSFGDGYNHFYLKASALFGNTVTLKGGAERDVFSLDSAATHSFLKGLTVDLGVGPGSFNVNDDAFHVNGGALSIKGVGGSADYLTSYLGPKAGSFDTTVAISLSAGSTNLGFGVAGGNIHFNAALTVSGSTGDDTVLLAGNVTASVSMSFDLKDGHNVTQVMAGSSLSSGAFVVKGGSGIDSLTLGDTSVIVTGPLTASFADGLGYVGGMSGLNLTVGSFNQYGGSGADQLIFNGATFTVFGKSNLDLGSGDNLISVVGTQSAFFGGDFAVNSKEGDDNILLAASAQRFLGSVSFRLGDGVNAATMNVADVAGNFTYIGGKGNDTLAMQTSALQIGRGVLFNAGDGNNALLLSGNTCVIGGLTYNGGKNSDAVTLGQAGRPITVLGGASLAFGAGTTQAALNQALIKGALSMTGNGAALDTDSLTINKSTIYGATTLKFGAGASTFTVNDSTFLGAVSADLGAGNDTVNLDTTASTTAGNIWLGSVKIVLGLGNDAMTIGADSANATNQFSKSVSVDGGIGSDTLNLATNVFLDSALTQTNFP